MTKTNEPPRVFAGFSTLLGGMNGGVSASLIGTDQCAFARDFTFRDGFIKTRAPFANRLLTFDNATTQANFSGIFQGASVYNTAFGGNGFVVSRAGKLFFINVDNNFVITEITPRLTIQVTVQFTVPAGGAQVLVTFNGTATLAVGNVLVIDSGSYTIAAISGDQFLLTYSAGAAHATVAVGTQVLIGSTPVVEFDANPSNYDLIYLFQAEKYVIVLGGQHKTIIYDGSTSRLAGVGELPPAVFGIYVWGRIWLSLNDNRSFIAGDIVYGQSGTAQERFLDAILKTTENDFLNEGGNFSVPQNAGPITSMIALATQDTSLGIGNLLVGTTNMMFSVNTPVDRTTWKNLTYPIQTISLIDYGPVSPRGISSINGDVWYRSIDGIRSFQVVRRNFGQPGNVPISREMSKILDADDPALLIYGSSILFDNRFYTTVSPYRDSSGAVAHKGVAVVNFDSISSIRNQFPPAWEGVYTGLNILQLVKGQFSGQERAFAFVLNGTAVELWEIMRNGYYDQFTQVSGPNTSITRVSIQPQMETRSEDFGQPAVLKKLHTAELYLDDIVDTISLVIKFRPDQYPVWTTWATVNLCTTVSQCTVQAPVGTNCVTWKPNAKGYAARILLPRPDDSVCNLFSQKPTNLCYEMQFRLELTGHCRIRKFVPHALLQTDKMDGDCPPAEATCITVQNCELPVFDYSSHGP